MKPTNDGAYTNNDELGPLDDLDLNDLDLEAGSSNSQASDAANQSGAEAGPTLELTPAVETPSQPTHEPASASIVDHSPVAIAGAMVAPAESKSGSRSRIRTRKTAGSEVSDDELDEAITSTAAYQRARQKQLDAALEMERTIAKLRAQDPRNKARRLQILGEAVETTFRKNEAHWNELIKSIEINITEPRDRALFVELVKIDSDRARAETVPAIGKGVEVRVRERPHDRPRHLGTQPGKKAA